MPDHVHRVLTMFSGLGYQEVRFISGNLGNQLPRDYYPCSPAVPSRLVAEAVDGAVALDSIFSGVLYCRYKFTICVYLFPFRF